MNTSQEMASALQFILVSYVDKQKIIAVSHKIIAKD